MTIKCSVFIATSLDGFIARTNGDLDWLPGSDGTITGDDYGFYDFFSSIDTLIIGRNTYELARTFNEWPYSGKRVIVLSRNFPNSPKSIGDSIMGTSLPPPEVLRYLSSLGASHAYIDGGKTIQSFFRDNLINELIITKIPILIGEGITLFGPLIRDIKLQHVSTKAFKNGFLQCKYTVLNGTQ